MWTLIRRPCTLMLGYTGTVNLTTPSKACFVILTFYPLTLQYGLYINQLYNIVRNLRILNYFRWSFICGCASGSISAAVVNPADVVKTRLQLLKKGSSEVSYNGIADAFVKIFKNVNFFDFWTNSIDKFYHF